MVGIFEVQALQGEAREPRRGRGIERRGSFRGSLRRPCDSRRQENERTPTHCGPYLARFGASTESERRKRAMSPCSAIHAA